MIVVTGAAGFIGSCMVNKLNNKGYRDIIVVDDFSRRDKNRNLEHKVLRDRIHRERFMGWLEEHHVDIEYVIHLGARTDTTESDREVFRVLNLDYSKGVWEACSRHSIPLIYASSAATYGDGSLGYDDSHDLVEHLQPLNPYGESKNDFDKWVLKQKETPPFWAGIRFFNVYGPNEYHKGRMASVIIHAFRQIRETGRVRLFRSHRREYRDGEQLRDFIYVKDVVDVIYYLMKQGLQPGIFNLGTGRARTFLDLAHAVFRAMDIAPHIGFIDTPEDIREKYQYFTEARMEKLRCAGYELPFYTLEEGVSEYVRGYLAREGYY
ncbi:MAG: ADP-glyceromanno-heptose 6-epimerase [Bacteroidales bacterium]|nr:ADP-glyceromanno-heptose 6-epimerase [Bacteroidales bacterium]